MNIFLVVPTEPNDDLDAAVGNGFPHDSYRLPNGEWLVAYNGTTKELSNRLDLSEGKRGSAIVVSIAHYWGFAANDIWEWIAVKERQA